MNFKKRVNGSWTDTTHYIHNTSTDTLTALPADIYANDTTATVGLKGDMSQSSTPTPTTPIQPSETGDMGINLTPNQKITSSSYSVTLTTHPLINALKNITPNENYTLSWEFSSNGSGGVSNQVRLYTSASGTLIKILQLGVSFTLTSEEIANLGALFCYFGIGNTDGYMDKFMLVEGSTHLPYEPYGIKIPILSNSQITNVYLGEVQTTRRIKKLILTGEETWNYATSSQVHWIENVPNDYDNKLISKITTTCTHYRCIQNNTGFSGMVNGDLRLYAKESSPIAHELYIKDETYTSATDFKAYLQQQYANGTPVTVWYVLATPETAVVNEPIRKIGDYADEVANVSIPVTAGTNTIDIDTTLKPSEVSVNYKGWHPVQSVHEKSRNLFDANTIYSAYKQPDGTYQATRSVFYGLKVKPFSAEDIGKTFTFAMSISPVSGNVRVCGNIGGTIVNGTTTGTRSVMTFTVASIDDTVYLNYGSGGDVVTTLSDIMLNAGSTALPYEPYWT